MKRSVLALGLAVVLSTGAAHAAPAASCLTGAASVTVVPGEVVAPRERDARVGWLAWTYVSDARVALAAGRPDDAIAAMAEAGALLDVAEDCARDQAVPVETAAADIADAAAALASDDRATAETHLGTAQGALYRWVIALDTRLYPGAAGATP